MIKLAAMDMDGTFLRTDKSVSSYTQDVLLRARDQGMILVAASGRPEDSLAQCIKGVEGFSYAICSNGSVILQLEENARASKNYTNKACTSKTCASEACASKTYASQNCVLNTGIHGDVSGSFDGIGHEASAASVIPGSRVIRRLVMDERSVEALIAIIEEIDAPAECFVRGRSFTNRDYWEDGTRFGATSAAAAYVHATRQPVEDIRAFMWEHRHELDALDIITDTAMLRKKALERARRVDNIYITSSVASLVEISHCDSGKAPALKWLCDLLGLSPGAVAAFGNEENDRDMLNWAGTGVAVDNSPDSLKADADIIAPDNDSDGVAVVLEGFL